LPRTLIAALAALAVALILPTAASAQYAPPYFYPTGYTTPHPPVAGLQDHPFGFGANWALGSPLEADFADYAAWRGIESDYRMRAGAYSDGVYYGLSGVIGTSFSGPIGDGTNWQVRIVRYVPPATGRLGHYCAYEGVVNGPVLPAGLNVFTQTQRTCETYVHHIGSIEGG
jgi:hypothetical protein